MRTREGGGGGGTTCPTKVSHRQRHNIEKVVAVNIKKAPPPQRLSGRAGRYFGVGASRARRSCHLQKGVAGAEVDAGHPLPSCAVERKCHCTSSVLNDIPTARGVNTFAVRIILSEGFYSEY
jgi:hypothetical protein